MSASSRNCAQEAAMGPRTRSSLLSALLLFGLTANVARAAWPHDPRANVRVAPTTSIQSQSSIVSDGAGGAIVAWSDNRSGNADIYAQHITAAGVVDGSWPATGLLVCGASGSQGGPVMASDGA